MTEGTAAWTDVYRHEGPFSTVYLDVSRDNESGSREVELRWRELRETLAQAGAPDADLAALEASVTAERTPGRHGFVAVAGGGELLFEDYLTAPPRRAGATFAQLPDLMPYLAQSTDRVPYLLVVTDHSGAELSAVQRFGGELPPLDAADIHPHRSPVHKTGRDVWDERHFQNRVENNWTANAQEAAHAVLDRVRKTGLELVIVAGEPQARSLLVTQLREQLPPRALAVEAEHGEPRPGTAGELLTEEVRNAVLRQVWRHRRELLERLRQNLGRQQYAAAGIADVVAALRTAAVDTLVVSDDPSSTLRAYVGPEPAQLALTEAELKDMGVSDAREDRLDSALLRAAAGTGAHVLVTPNAHDYVPDGIAALLRY
jgi:hypothetical protein